MAGLVGLLGMGYARLAPALSPPRTLLGQTLEEFAARRESLRKAAGQSLIILTSLYPDNDRLRYRPPNNMVYLTGVTEAGSSVVFFPDGDPNEVTCAAFVRRSPDEVKMETGLEAVFGTREFWPKVRASLEKCGTVYVEGPLTDAGPSRSLMARLREIRQDVDIRDVRPLLAPLRVRKSPGEIANLRGAIAATVAGFVRGARAIRPGATELAVEGEILAGFRHAGAAFEGFPCIVGSGPNSIILHHEPTARPMARGETVVVDIGAEVNYYTADLTRTFPVGGRFTPRARVLYQTVLDVQKACAEHIVPGKTTWTELNRYAREQFRQSTLRAADSSGEMQTLDRFFSHSIGHYLGMDVHDVGSYGPIMPGSVITIEPGLYIASENIGIRIEDDYLITETSVERLSAQLASDIPSVERMVRR